MYHISPILDLILEKNILTIYAKILHQFAKFEDAHLYTPHGKRALGVTMLSNLSVSEQRKLKSSRHKSIKTYA